MSDFEEGADWQPPATIYCPQCGRPMRIAPEHVQVAVACPHCGQAIEPWRVLETGASPPPPPPPPAAPPIAPDAPPGYRYGYGQRGAGVYSWRNRWVAGLLGIFLGGLGVHRFYLGFTGIGILQIVVTFVTLGIGAIWGFIEGVLCLCGAMHDVDGLPLSD